MVPPFLDVLHVGPELTPLAYISRVLLHLAAFGGVAVLVLRITDVLGGLRSVFAPWNASRETDARDS